MPHLYGSRVTMGSHSFIWTIPFFTSQPQSVIALWLVLITPSHEGMARLSWPGWLITYRDEPHRELNPDTVTHLSTYRAGCTCRLTSLIETNVLLLRQTAPPPQYRLRPWYLSVNWKCFTVIYVVCLYLYWV